MNAAGVGLSLTVRDNVLGAGTTDGDTDASIAGFVLQQHLPLLSAFLSHTGTTLRSAALQLMGTLLRQGMLCPLDIIAQLVALQGDVDPDIRKASLNILQAEDQKRSSFIDNRLIEGQVISFERKPQLVLL